MIFGIFTIMLSVLPFVLYNQPLCWAYTGDGRDTLNEVFRKTTVYDAITFEAENGILRNLASGFMIATLVFAGLTLLLSLVNIIGRAACAPRVYGAKVAALLFFLSALTAVVLLGIDMAQVYGVKAFSQLFENTVGYGLLITFLSSLFALIFSPKRIKKAN